MKALGYNSCYCFYHLSWLLVDDVDNVFYAAVNL